MVQLLTFRGSDPVVSDQNTDAILKRMTEIFIYDEVKTLFSKLNEVIIELRSIMKSVKSDEFTSTLELVLYKYLSLTITYISLRVTAVFNLLMKLNPEGSGAVKEVDDLIEAIRKEISSLKHNFEQGTVELEKLKEQQ